MCTRKYKQFHVSGTMYEAGEGDESREGNGSQNLEDCVDHASNLKLNLVGNGESL